MLISQLSMRIILVRNSSKQEYGLSLFLENTETSLEYSHLLVYKQGYSDYSANVIRIIKDPNRWEIKSNVNTKKKKNIFFSCEKSSIYFVIAMVKIRNDNSPSKNNYFHYFLNFKFMSLSQNTLKFNYILNCLNQTSNRFSSTISVTA